jgi:2-C-methyl-D-erythritol 4-phosphate cytidylyltransferase
VRCRKQQLPETSAILAAAGSGERLGVGEPKALVELAGRPMYRWSLDALQGAQSVGGVVIAAPPGMADQILVGDDRTRAIEGGATRTESVLNALALCESELVLIHDAARPLATSDLFDRLIERVASDDSLAGAIAVSMIHDTVKRVDAEGSVVETIDRTVLRAAETPQVFRVTALREAIESAGAGETTDEAMLVEAAGGKVATFESDQENFKITTPADLERAAAILSTRP